MNHDLERGGGHFVRFNGWLRQDGEFVADIGWETSRPTQAIEGSLRGVVELVGSDGHVLESARPQIGDDDCASLGGGPRTDHLVAYVPFHSGAASIRLKIDDVIVHEREVSASPPELSLGRVELSGTLLVVEWTCTHPMPTTYDVVVVGAVDSDDERQLVRIAQATSDLGIEVEVAAIPVQGECMAVVLATDGVRSTTAQSRRFDLPPRPPIVTILRPSSSDHVSESDGISLIGHTMSCAGRALPDEDLVWRVDGEAVARGRRVAWIPPLAVGDHRVELSWRDEGTSVVEVVTVHPEGDADRAWTQAFREHAAALDS